MFARTDSSSDVGRDPWLSQSFARSCELAEPGPTTVALSIAMFVDFFHGVADCSIRASRSARIIAEGEGPRQIFPH